MHKRSLTYLCLLLFTIAMAIGCSGGSTQKEGEVPGGETGEEQVTGFVEEIYRQNGTAYLDIECVQFFTGEEAVEEAKLDGNAEKDEHGNYFVPNDYYIRNENCLRTYEISEDLVVKVCVMGSDAFEIVLLDEYLEIYYYDELRPIFLYHIIIIDNTVVELIEQYIP